MLPYLSSKFAEILHKNQLDTFEKVWDYQVNWFEEPNERRGGWSGVGRITIKDGAGEFGAFLKKQDKHCRTSFLHPIHGVPTFQREFEMMQFLAARNIRAPEVLFFGRNASDLKTTLLTKELADFVSLEEFTEKLFAKNRPTILQQQPVISATAKFARQLHEAKIQHRSFYPKHLFVNMANANAPQIAVIDLEKSRVNWLPPLRTLIDMATLNRHAKHWSKTRRMAFYLQYHGLKRLTPYAKWMCRMIIKRSTRA